MLSRRQLLASGASMGAASLLPFNARGALVDRGWGPRTGLATSLAKFVDPLPIPAVATPKTFRQGVPVYQIPMLSVKQKLHRDLPGTRVWGYNGLYPGKTIVARSGRPIYVRWINSINDPDYLIPGVYDPYLMGANMDEPHVRTVVHLHGGHVPPSADGNPEGWFSKDLAVVGPHFEGNLYYYPNNQDAATLWYHDHALGATRLNVYAGLAGFYILTDEHEESLNLPSGKYDLGLAIQDKSFNPDGSLFYPVRNPDEIPTGPDHPGPWVPEFFGDTMLVNGKIWPFLRVEPRRYRFRILNGCNSRFLLLSFGNGMPFVQIGAEQGLMPKSVELTQLLLGPAERADVIVDFKGFEGTSIRMLNAGPDGPFTLPGIDPPADPRTTGVVMQFRVNLPLSGVDTSSVPVVPRPMQRLDPADASVVRDMTLEEVMDEADEPIRAVLNGKRYDDPIEDKPVLGTTEVWNLINLTGDAHPMHLHLVSFQVLDRQEIDAEAYMEALEDYREGQGAKPILANFLLGSPLAPNPNEIAPKDTAVAYPGMVTRIITRFDDYVGQYPWHCHIVEHEDNDMMQRFEVVAPPAV